MADPIVRCPDHGLVSGPGCPACDREPPTVLAADRRERLSRFLSGLLRHFPDEYDLDLTRAGWADWEAVVGTATDRYEWATPEHVAAVVATDPKGRFERREGEVRAAYGHSVDVALDDEPSPVPDVLYHGTAPRNVDAILAEGLRPMSRREVHLSPTVEAARAVGARHADDPVVLAVDAAGMVADGHRVTRRGPETYTADEVPPAYLSVVTE